MGRVRSASPCPTPCAVDGPPNRPGRPAPAGWERRKRCKVARAAPPPAPSGSLPAALSRSGVAWRGGFQRCDHNNPRPRRVGCQQIGWRKAQTEDNGTGQDRSGAPRQVDCMSWLVAGIWETGERAGYGSKAMRADKAGGSVQLHIRVGHFRIFFYPRSPGIFWCHVTQ